MEKINLLTDERIKFGELCFDINQFELPKQFHVDFAKTREVKKYEEINGEKKRTDITDKVVLSAYDAKLVETLSKVGQSHEQIKSHEITIESNLDVIEALIAEDYSGLVKLTGLKAKPKWVSGNNASYRAVQLVADKIEKVG